MTGPRPAPARFPYHEHRTLAQVWKHLVSEDLKQRSYDRAFARYIEGREW